MRTSTILTMIVIALSLAGCASIGSSAVPQGNGSLPNRRSLVLRMLIPGPHHYVRHRGARFVSPSTNAVFVQVYPHGATRTAGSLIVQSAINVSSGSPACAGEVGFPRTCVAQIWIPPTSAVSDDILVATYDQAPVGGTIPGTAHALGIGALSGENIVAGEKNSFTVFLGGIVASLTGNRSSIDEASDGSRHQVAIVIDPEDFGGNPITAGNNDPFANPITVSISEAGGSGHVQLSLDGGTGATSVIVRSSSDGVVLNYDGKSPLGYSVTITLNAPATANILGASESVSLAPLSIGSSNDDYSPALLAFAGEWG